MIANARKGNLLPVYLVGGSERLLVQRCLDAIRLAAVGPGPRGGVCNAAPAQGVIGKQGTPSVIEKARVASGAAMARLLHPRQVVTLEFNAERLNLVVDGKGRITAVRCG